MPKRTLAFLLLISPVAAAGQTRDVRSLLERVEAAYRFPHSYYFDAVDRLETMSVGLSVGHESRTILAQQSPGQFRFERRGDFRYVTVSDGSITWAYLPAEHQYTRDDAVLPDEEGSSDTTPLARATARLVGAWACLTQWADRAEIAREEDVVMEGARVRAVVVRVRPEKAGGTTQELWIDPARLVVLRSVVKGHMRTGRGAPLRYQHSIIYKAAHLNESLPRELFAFTPPKGSRQVEFFAAQSPRHAARENQLKRRPAAD